MDALQYKPNIENMMEDMENGSDEEEDDESKHNYSSSDDEGDEEEAKARKQVFKAAKMNPVAFEDKDTKKARQKQLYEMKKASRSDYVNELRREIYDLPEEVHLGGMSTQRTRFTREQEQIERLEQENMKRMNFTKKELKDMRSRAQEEMQGQRLDNLVEDLRGLDNILSSGKRGRREDDDQMEMENQRFSKSLKNFVKNKGDLKNKGGSGFNKG